MDYITKINVGQGESLLYPIPVRDPSSGALVDMTGYSFTGSIRENYTTEVSGLSFSFDTGSIASGSVSAILTPEQTILLTQRKYVYDVYAVSPVGFRERISEGYVVVRPTVTR